MSSLGNLSQPIYCQLGDAPIHAFAGLESDWYAYQENGEKWSLKDGKPAERISSFSSSPAKKVRTSADLATLIFANSKGVFLRSKERVRELVTTTKPLYDLAITQDGRFAAVALADEVQVWELDSETLVARYSSLKSRDPVTALVFESDEGGLIAGTRRGLIFRLVAQK